MIAGPRGLGGDPDGSTAGGRLSCSVSGAPGRGHLHRLRLVGDPRRDHRTPAWFSGSGWGRSGPKSDPRRLGGDSLSRASGSVSGLLVGAGLTQLVRKSCGFVFRREAMGFGDVTLMGMIGAFLGWQAAVLTFFIAPFLRTRPRGVEAGERSQKTAQRRPINQCRPRTSLWALLEHGGGDAFLSLGPGSGDGWAEELFHTLYVIFWWLLGYRRRPSQLTRVMKCATGPDRPP